MHKAIFLEGTLHLTLQPNGPLLIKAGETGGADPTLPDMEFVRTERNGEEQVYIPGPSLKGVVRAQAERICRSLDSETQQQARLQQRQQLDAAANVPLPDQKVPLADNPLGEGTVYNGMDDLRYNSGRAIEALLNHREHGKELQKRADHTAIIYRRSSFVSQMFGHTSLAGRVRFADAYLVNAPRLEERNGVAIDRIYGSVAVGPFNYETLVAGTFHTRIDFKNVMLAQLGLLGLALRDLAEGRVGLGFGKSRGLGRVRVTFEQMELRYPTCELVEQEIRLLSGRSVVAVDRLAGIGALCQDGAYQQYDFPADDSAPLPDGLAYIRDEFLGVRLVAQGDEHVRAIWRACMPCWKQVLGL
jgi:CRISPR/Cas system CSM-associated protein Csm3 (group 7 of RAMP superfamily)